MEVMQLNKNHGADRVRASCAHRILTTASSRRYTAAAGSSQHQCAWHECSSGPVQIVSQRRGGWEMKARVILAVAAGLLALVLPAIASGDASVTIGTTGCGVLDSNGNCVAAPFRDVVTNSATGVEIERTYASGVFND